MRVFFRKLFLIRLTSFFSIISFIFTPLLPLQAGLFSAPKVPMPNASDMASDVEKRYHINTESVQEQGETMNVVDQKKTTPQVSLFFSPSDPKEGEKLNAQAFPIYFITEPKHMYFTWYLQRKNCAKRNGPLATTELRSCDADGNDRIDEEDWKIEAARIIASNGYDTTYTDYGSDSDADGYSARFGGDNRANVGEYCYYHDNATGENYEIVGDANDPDFGCNNGLQPVCMESTIEIGPGSGNVSNSSLANGLSLYYRFDDGTDVTVTDSSPSDNTGILVNGPVWTTEGYIEGALDMDGSDDYVRASDGTDLNMGDGDNFTIAGWFNRSTFATDDTLVAKRNGTDATDVGYIAYIDDATGRLVVEVSDGTDEYSIQSSATFGSTGWHHFAFVWNDASSADTDLYIDGVVDNGTVTGTLTDIGDLSNVVDYTVGAESDGGNPFDGQLDEHRFYTRLLSAGEVVTLEGLTTPTEVSFNTSLGSSALTGFPYCSRSGVVACLNGIPCCVDNPASANSCEQDITGGVCTVATLGSSNPVCEHLFPHSSTNESGNGSFGAQEERFWGTDPNDPDTADNGNKDEANVVGLGRENFSWNYTKGDRVGVVIEGTSMVNTKYADSTNMIMWAFSKNDCDVAGAKGSFQKNIKGYEVTVPTIEIDLNDCLEANLVDPLEGGQATKLEVALQATPEDPINDSSDRDTGDTVEVSAIVNNSAKTIKNTYFDWKVFISPNATINPPNNGWHNITNELMNLPGDRRILSQVKGNGLDRIRLRLNLKNNDPLEGGRLFSSYLSGGIAYLRFQAEVAENFSTNGANRRGKADVLVKIVSTEDRIAAYIVDVSGDPARLSLKQDSEICSGTIDPADTNEERKILTRLDAKLCRVVKNEIIGLEFIGVDVSNYNWSINGLPLVCNTRVSNSCFDDKQGAINFFPIIGNVGDIFTVTATANKVDHDSLIAVSTSGEKVVTLSRAFKIVEPEVAIVSGDENLAWPKVLGRYTDVAGKSYTDFSKTTLQAFSGSDVKLKAVFAPEFLGSYLPPEIERAWTVDGQPVGDGSSNTITFSTMKEPGGIYNVGLSVAHRPKASVRKALQDIWNVSVLDSKEAYFSTGSQLEHPEETTIARTGVNKYLALASSYLPSSLLFSIRIFLSIGLILFVTGFLFALIPNASTQVGRRE